MKTAADCCRIVADRNNVITHWVCRGLKTDSAWVKNYRTLGVMKGDRLLAGLIFHDVRYGQDVWWTIYSIDKHWCSKRIIKAFMREAFEVMKCRRINLLVNPENTACLNFVTRLGFKIEGRLRAFREDGKDCCLLGLLKSENKYL